jgi:hypothetical protein
VLTYRLTAPVTGSPRVFVVDAAGDTIARLTGASTAGLHRVTWNMMRGGGGGMGGGGGGRGMVAVSPSFVMPGFPAGFNPRPAEARGEPDSSQTPAAVRARLLNPRAGGGGGGFGGGGFGGAAAQPVETGDYRVVLDAGGTIRTTVLRVVRVNPGERAVMVPAVR